MAIEFNRSNTIRITGTNRLPAMFVALQQQLEQIRQEQLAKNRSTLRTLAAEQRAYVEILTLAITRKIFDDVMQEWEVSAARGDEAEISEIIALIWGSMEIPAGISHVETVP